jgi:hypothetical protein
LPDSPRRNLKASDLENLIRDAATTQIDAGHITLFERGDEFITLATEFLFQQHD